MLSIFVSVASYRDRDVEATVRDLFGQAAFPGRVACGVCVQDLPGDRTLRWSHENLRIIRTDALAARGPLAARQEILRRLYRGEDYYLQLDSHTRFAPGWDVTLLEELGRTGAPGRSSIITAYPVEHESLHSETRVPHMVKTVPYPRDPRIQKNVAVLQHPKSTPSRVPHLAAGFLFGPARPIVAAYPMEDLPYLFQGEERLLEHRFLNKGMKFFAPTRNIVSHAYGRFDEPKFWKDHPRAAWEAGERRAITRVLELIGRRAGGP